METNLVQNVAPANKSLDLRLTNAKMVDPPYFESLLASI